MILANRIGVISLDELAAWADEKILNTNEPPSFIIDLALGEIPESPQELDIVRNEMGVLECSQLAQMISEKLYKKEIDLNEFGLQCYKLALIAKDRPRELLHWISDEIYLCSEGVKSFPESEAMIKVAINEIVAISA
jgi:hypothetical protein